MEFETGGLQMFNYSDIFFSCYSDNERMYRNMVKDHTLVYVYSGELLLQEGKTEVCVRKGECVFLRKDNRVCLTKQPKGKEQFCGISMIFSRSFLRDFYQRMDKKLLPVRVQKWDSSVIRLPGMPAITSLFQSMLPYFDTSVKPTDRLVDLKLQEGVYALLDIDRHFYPSLFDFTEPWKIDIMDFMEDNYAYDLTMEDVAHYTGRSLATFKRDFKKLSALSPQKWLMKKRLDIARDKLLHENKKVSDVYLEVGFKNISHFSSAYKKQFGYPPSR